MKKMYLFLALLSIARFNVSAQTVDVVWAIDSTDWVSNCIGSNTYFFFEVATTGYSPTDIGTMTIDFGDGNSMIMNDVNLLAGYPDNFWATVDYVYPNQGVYDITFIFTMPDGNSDTLYMYNEVEITACETISGYVFCDDNTNCIFDGTDSYLDGMQVYAVDNSSTPVFAGFASVDASGYYEINVPAGTNYDLTFGWNILPLSAFICPTTGTINTSAPSANNNFSMNCSSDFDLEPIYYTGFFHPGFTQPVSINIANNMLSSAPDGQVRIVMNHPLVTFVSGEADGGDMTPTISGDTLTWDLPGLYVYQTGLAYSYNLTVDFQTDPAAIMGDTICFQVITEPITGDINPANNIKTICLPVQNSYDPNFVEVNPVGKGTSGIIEANTELVYTVHFQNTGNFPATNIMVKDYLNPAVHNMSTFTLLGSSHTITEILPSGTDGTIIFNFENINLPDSTSDEPNSHGWVAYRIQQINNLAPGTSIENTAGIYFDFNAPVITNTALNTINDPLTIMSASEALNMTVYPVPSTGLIHVNNKSGSVMQYTIVNLSGEAVYSGLLNEQVSIDLSELTNGLYVLQTSQGDVLKIVIHK